MLSASSQFAVEVQGQDMIAACRVTVELPGDLTVVLSDDESGRSAAVKAWRVDSSTTTDQPANTRYAVGYPAVAADLTLAGTVALDGADRDVAWLFSPYQTGSPLYRQKIRGARVTVDTGLYPKDANGTPELLRQFTGYIDSYGYDPAAGTVTLSCIDRRNDLRSTVDVPAVVTSPPFNAGLTAEFAVDALLRSATGGAVSSWPARRVGCVLAAGMRASIWPEVGTLVTDSAQPEPVFAAGPYGTGLADTHAVAGGFSEVVYTLDIGVGGDFYVEMLVNDLAADDSNAVVFYIGDGFDAGVSEFFGVTILGDLVGIEWSNPSGSDSDTLFPTAQSDPGPHVIGFAFHMAPGSASWSVTVTVDGTAVSTGTRTASVPRNVASYSTFALVQAVGPGEPVCTVAGVQVSTENDPATSYPFTPGAVLDPSLNPLTVIPAISGDPWQAIQQIADAEQAVAGWDQASDVFRFQNRETIRTGTTVRTITSRTSLVALQIGADGSGFADKVQVPFTEWAFGARTIVWSLDEVKKIPRGTTVYLNVTTDGLVADIDTAVSQLPDSGGGDGNSYYRSSGDKFGASHGGRLNIRVFQSSATALTIRIQNPTATDLWLLSSAEYTDLAAGTPLLQVGGRMVTPGSEQSVERSTGDGLTAYQAGSNPWLQAADPADQIATDLLSSLAVERPNLTGLSIIPDPRLQLCDRVRIQDPDVSGLDDYAVIFGQTVALEAGDDGRLSYTHSIDARAVAKPGGWILGVTGRTELALTTLI